MLSRHTAGYWIARFVAGIALLVVAGTGLLRSVVRDPLGLVTMLAGVTGFWLAMKSITPLIRALALRSRMRVPWSEAAQDAFARASLPRRIYYLLAAVAEADAPMSPAERGTVRHFVLERFLDAASVAELHRWEAQPLQVADRQGLAARIAAHLDPGELDTLFCWCCLVAFADGRYAEHEHAALQDVARGLGLPGPRARMLFHLARAQFLRGQQRGEPTRPGPALDQRAQALATLGLPADSKPEQIRRRHRELVRRFHPDAQPNLGPVAQREATERFQEIQRAYETLSP